MVVTGVGVGISRTRTVVHLDDIILILIVGYVYYITITGGSSQHGAVALFNLYVAASGCIVTWMRFRSVLLKWGTL